MADILGSTIARAVNVNPLTPPWVRGSAAERLSRSVEDDLLVLRLVGLLLILFFTCLGVVLLVEGQGATRVLGFVFVLTGATWFSVDLLRRRGVI